MAVTYAQLRGSGQAHDSIETKTVVEEKNYGTILKVLGSDHKPVLAQLGVRIYSPNPARKRQAFLRHCLKTLSGESKFVPASRVRCI